MYRCKTLRLLKILSMLLVICAILLTNVDAQSLFEAPISSGEPVLSGHDFSTSEVGDFNGDNVLDLVECIAVDNGRLYIKMGNGDRTFYTSEFYQGVHGVFTGVYSCIPIIGDLNNDGFSDLTIKAGYSLSTMMTDNLLLS